jgi:hypothetical protein
LNDVLVGDTYPWDFGSKLDPEPGYLSLFFSENGVNCDTEDLRLCGSKYNIQEPVADLPPAPPPPNDEGDCFGWDVAFLGDIDGDGKDDFTASAPRGPFYIAPGDTPPYDPPGSHWTESGQVFLFLSSLQSSAPACQVTLSCGPSGSLASLKASKAANLILEGVIEGQRLGHAIVRCGGFVAIGAPGGWKTDGPGST